MDVQAVNWGLILALAGCLVVWAVIIAGIVWLVA